VSCVWFSPKLLDGNYKVIVLLGEPGAGKTTAALHIVAHDLLRRGVAKTYDEAFLEAAKRLFLGATTEELVEFLKLQVRGGRRADWIIIDDAALGFLDVESTRAWSAIMDALKVARGSIAERGIIITSTARSFVAKRLMSTANVVYVSRRHDVYLTTRLNGAGRCEVVNSDVQNRRIVLKRIEWMVRSHDTIEASEAKLGIFSYIVGLIPVDRRYAMPREVETEHIESRRRRVEAQLEKALELLRRKKAQESDQIE
jgi:RecA/RadA recombinase